MRHVSLVLAVFALVSLLAAAPAKADPDSGSYYGIKGVMMPKVTTNPSFGGEYDGDFSGGLALIFEKRWMRFLAVGSEFQWLAMIPDGGSFSDRIDVVNLDITLRPGYTAELWEAYVKLAGGMSLAIPQNSFGSAQAARDQIGLGWNAWFAPGAMYKPVESFGVFAEIGGYFMGTYHNIGDSASWDSLTMAMMINIGIVGIL